MRAMMSDVGGSPAFTRAPIYADVIGRVHVHEGMARNDAFAAEWAEREARAILAESEPSGVHAQASWGQRGVYCLPGAMATVLAEALAAFVAEE